jgi:D-3-phosphoglycerate dehydrogenase
MRVFLTHDAEDREAYFGRALPGLAELAEVVLNESGGDLTTAELVAASDGCDVIVAHRSAPGEAELFASLPRLIAFLRCAVDISTVDVEAASTQGVLVARADHSYVASTAELALGLMLDVERQIAASTVDYRSGLIPPQRSGRQMRGKVAGIIGYGRIGSHLADLLLALGMEVLVADPFVTQPAGVPVRFVEMRDLLASADVVFPLAPGGAATTDLIGASELALLKPGASLVNVSRGELLDEAAVADALRSGRLAGLAMDVGRSDDQRPSPALAALPGVVATPHLGGLTPENADAQAASSVEQVAAMLQGQIPPRTVNPDSATRLRGWWSTNSE